MTTEPAVAVSDGLPVDEAVAAVSMGTPEYRTCPYPVYRSLREQAPVCKLTTRHGVDTYLITRYEDARLALSDPRIGKDMHEGIDIYHAVFGDTCDALDDNLIFADPLGTPGCGTSPTRPSPRATSSSCARASSSSPANCWPSARRTPPST